MTINELKIACYLYERFTDYDKGYRLIKSIDILDLTIKDHSMKLLEWLRSWGCRQFKVDNTEMSLKALNEWYLMDSEFLPDHNVLLHDSEEKYLNLTEGIFNRLRDTKISERYNSTSEVNVGPVGAAKILFALRPNFYSPWDRPICQSKGYQLDGADYIKYLRDIQKILYGLKNECIANGITLHDLKKITKRPISSLTKLVDEYNWVTITKNCNPSDIIELLKN